SDLGPSIAAARREAQGAFGDSTLLVERWIDRPRHVEVQVFADTLGNMVTLGERECSLQRRHQKIVEETPSPLLDATTRAAMTKSALDVASSCGYVSAGTVEFIVSDDRPDEYFFMEMNTRLQVEHPVTEAVTGVDLVEWQLRVAAGEALPVAQDAVFSRGHAVEVRVYAEDPVRGFLPASGAVALVALPTGRSHVRVDSALTRGSVVGTRYDPMLAKVVAWGETRDEALDRLRAALEETAVLGVTTNVGYLTRLLAHRDVVAGRLDTGLVDRTLGELAAPDEVESRDAAVVAACRLAISLEPPSPEPTGTFIDPWELRDGWSVGGPREWNAAFLRDGHKVSVSVRGHVRNGRDGATLRVDDGPSLRVRAVAAAGGPGPAQPDARLSVTIDGATAMWLAATQGDDIWVSRGGDAWRFGPDRAARGEAGVIAGAAGPVRSPMPGVVVAVHVSAGNAVHAGQPLLAVEAMKMEHTVVAPVDGVVAELLVRTGQTVGLDELLARVEAGGSVACAAGTGPGLGVLDDDDVGEQEAGL
ncbi:MAG TPA: biotin/lipoyl-containing protein, partial [Acidimicrobiales bacterium]|nr:biotin/lipoyl-containing protein [Acidimicrobiales bacterium]